MKPESFNKIREQAVELFHSQPVKLKDKISLDALFIALSINASHAAPSKAVGPKPETRIGRETPPEPWFSETLAKLKLSKEKDVTIERFLLVAGRFPVSRMDRINTARWLRESGHIPRKTGGNLIFDI